MGQENDVGKHRAVGQDGSDSLAGILPEFA
jgi:hypothetical protein